MDRKNMSLDELIDLVSKKITFLKGYGFYAHSLVAFGYLRLLQDIQDGLVNLDFLSIDVENCDFEAVEVENDEEFE